VPFAEQLIDFAIILAGNKSRELLGRVKRVKSGCHYERAVKFDRLNFVVGCVNEEKNTERSYKGQMSDWLSDDDKLCVMKEKKKEKMMMMMMMKKTSEERLVGGKDIIAALPCEQENS